jgi:hypothetical protein
MEANQAQQVSPTEDGDMARLKELRDRKRLTELRAKSNPDTALVSSATGDENLLERNGLMDWLAGQVEPTITTGTALAGSALGGIAGTGQAIMNNLAQPYPQVEGLPAPPEMQPNTSPANIVGGYQNAMTYQPRTETGGALVEGMARDYDNYVEKPVMSHLRTGDATLERTNNPLLATINELGPEIVGTVFGLKAMKRPQKPTSVKVDKKKGGLVSSLDKKGNIESDIRFDKTTERSAGYKLDKAGALVRDKLQKKAINKGWSEKSVSWAAKQSTEVRTKLRDMLNVAEDYFTNFEADARPTDLIGKTAAEQASFVNGVRAKSGRVMDVIANSDLAKQRIYIAKLRSDFHIAVRRLRGNITPDGLEFDPKSKISSNTGDIRVLKELEAKLKAYGSKPTGQELHEFKQWAADQVNLNKSPLNKSDGITAGVEKILNNARAEANRMLRETSAPYAKANDIYSETKTALDTLQKGAGNVDMFGEGSGSALGTTMNRLLGNAQSRRNVTVGLNKVQDAAIKYQGDGPKLTSTFERQNYVAQTRFVDEMERLWGPFTETSFKAQSGDSAARMLQNPSIAQAGREVVDLTAKQIKKMSQSRAKQLESLRELLYQRGD